MRMFITRTKINWLLGALAAAVCAIAWTQGPASSQSTQEAAQDSGQQGFKIGVEVNMVTVPVTVRKPGGGFVKNLPKEAFNVQEDGEKQEILTFTQEAVPTRVAIVLDISGSVRSEWGSIKFSTEKFLENLQADDRFALITFNTETRLKMDWGRSTERVDTVLSSVYCKDNTDLWDAVWVVSNEVFKGIREKKAMIIMSDGLDNNSGVSYGEALSAAIHSEATVYIVSKTQAVRQMMMYQRREQRIYDNIPDDVFVQADLALRKLAYETGGRVLYPNSFGQLDNVYADVGEELRNQYTLGYVSTNQVKDGSYRRIDVAVAAPGASISARPGYFVPNALPGAAPKPFPSNE
jgi:Ca-activated chloride channel family protein